MDRSEIIRALRPLLDKALIATDFDGTLAPLVLDPSRSRPVEGALEALIALAERGAQIAVITGRDARTVLHLGDLERIPGIVVAGMYGIETFTAGELETPPTPPEIEQLRERLPAAVANADPQVWIEDKRLSLVVHTRRSADPAGEVDRLRPAVQAVADDLGLELHRGSDVLELRLPGYDKAGALRRLAQGHRGVLFLGDDVGDLPALGQIRDLRAAGVTAFGVAVRSSQVADLDGAADLDVDDPASVVELLRDLSEPAQASSEPARGEGR